MSIVTQLPTFYLRGSLATQTMTNLSKEQQEQAAKTVEYVANHPEMQKHKRKYLRRISDTIGGEYRDSQAAEQDYLIIIWRGVVMLYFHKEYEYQCIKCGSNTYKNQSGTVSEIRRQTEECPNCGQKGDDGDSPIHATVVADRHLDPESVIKDENQMSKWFSMQLTNAVRQQLRENPIYTDTRTQIVTDYADKFVVSSLINLLNTNKIAHQVVKTSHHGYDVTDVYFDTLACSAKIISQISVIRSGALEDGVLISSSNTGVKIQRGSNCNSITMPIVEKYHVKVAVASQRKPDSADPTEVPGAIDNIKNAISSDFLEEVDDCLPSKECRAVCQIIQQKGEWHDAYINKYGDVKWTWKNIETFLGLTKKEMSTIREQMKAVLISLLPDFA